MGGHPSPEITCNICSKPVDLTVDLFADEHSKTVHEDCYVNSIVCAQIRAATEKLFNGLSSVAPLLHCPKCGSLLRHMDATFSSQHGKTWSITLPLGEQCNVRDSFPAAYMDA